MTKVFAIAMNTFKEAVRNKVFYTLLFFLVLFSALAMSLSTLILGGRERLLVNMGLFGVEFFGLLIAIFVGISLVYKEMERRTIYTIISKPIFRYQFILGKYLGLSLTLIVEFVFMAFIFYLVLLVMLEEVTFLPVLAGIWMIFLKLMIITAIAVLFSSFSTPILSGMFTFAFYLIGQTSGFLALLMNPEENPLSATFLRVLMFVLPDFQMFNITSRIVFHEPISAGLLVDASFYALFYAAIGVFIAIAVFERRDLK